MDKEIGYTLCPADGLPSLLDPVFRWGLQQRLGYDAPGAGQPCGHARPQGVSVAIASLTR